MTRSGAFLSPLLKRASHTERLILPHPCPGTMLRRKSFHTTTSSILLGTYHVKHLSLHLAVSLGTGRPPTRSRETFWGPPPEYERRMLRAHLCRKRAMGMKSTSKERKRRSLGCLSFHLEVRRFPCPCVSNSLTLLSVAYGQVKGPRDNFATSHHRDGRQEVSESQR